MFADRFLKCASGKTSIFLFCNYIVIVTKFQISVASKTKVSQLSLRSVEGVEFEAGSRQQRQAGCQSGVNRRHLRG